MGDVYENMFYKLPTRISDSIDVDSLISVTLSNSSYKATVFSDQFNDLSELGDESFHSSEDNETISEVQVTCSKLGSYVRHLEDLTDVACKNDSNHSNDAMATEIRMEQEMWDEIYLWPILKADRKVDNVLKPEYHFKNGRTSVAILNKAIKCFNEVEEDFVLVIKRQIDELLGHTRHTLKWVHGQRIQRTDKSECLTKGIQSHSKCGSRLSVKHQDKPHVDFGKKIDKYTSHERFIHNTYLSDTSDYDGDISTDTFISQPALLDQVNCNSRQSSMYDSRIPHKLVNSCQNRPGDPSENEGVLKSWVEIGSWDENYTGSDGKTHGRYIPNANDSRDQYKTDTRMEYHDSFEQQTPKVHSVKNSIHESQDNSARFKGNQSVNQNPGHMTTVPKMDRLWWAYEDTLWTTIRINLEIDGYKFLFISD